MRYIIIIFILGFTIQCRAQLNNPEFVKIKTIDKQIFQGELISITSDSVTIKNKFLGVITLPKSTVKIIYNNPSFSNGNNNSEPFYVPTAIPNGAGRHFYRNYAFFGQNLSFGLNNNLDVSFGFELLSIFVNDEAAWPVMQIGAKYSGAIANNIHLGLSTKVLFNNDGGGTFTSVPITLGGLRTNFTFAPTLSRALGDGDREFAAFYNFNISLSDKVRIINDGLYLDDVLVGTTLLEIKIKKDILLQPGIIYSNDFRVLPNFSLTAPFGSKKKK
jgi:hypothetical protein